LLPSKQHGRDINLDLTDAEAAALVTLLKHAIGKHHYPLSPRLQTLRAILAKLSPEPAREPLPPTKVYEPPKATAAGRRRAGAKVTCEPGTFKE